jgi:hypothetical protein
MVNLAADFVRSRGRHRTDEKARNLENAYVFADGKGNYRNCLSGY